MGLSAGLSMANIKRIGKDLLITAKEAIEPLVGAT
jgi:hypothetical protein